MTNKSELVALAAEEWKAWQNRQQQAPQQQDSNLGGLLSLGQSETDRYSGPPLRHVSPEGYVADLPEPCIWDEAHKGWWPVRYGPLPDDPVVPTVKVL